MKKIILSIIVLCGVLLAPTAVFAQVDINNEVCNRVSGTRPAFCNPEPPANTVSSTIARITSLVAVITGIVSVVMVTVGGIKYVLSGGDAGKVNSAKNTIIYALVGLLVAISAGGIVLFVLNRT